jgi:predicted Zn-dependent protease
MPEWHFDYQERAVPMMAGMGPQDAESSSYNSGMSLIQQQQYDQAVVRFDRAIAQKGAHTDGAWYWKAFAQFKAGKNEDALASIAALRKDFPQSRYLNDAKVLEADVRKPPPRSRRRNQTAGDPASRLRSREGGNWREHPGGTNSLGSSGRRRRPGAERPGRAHEPLNYAKGAAT